MKTLLKNLVFIKYFVIFCFLLQNVFPVLAQKDSISRFDREKLKKRYSFAKSYFGVDMLFIPEQTDTYFLSDNSVVAAQRAGFVTPAINIGATHFWGYTDFYISIATPPISLGEDEIQNSTNFGVLTGARIYPLRLGKNRISPFVGYKFSPIRYLQENTQDEQYRCTQVKSMYDVGIAYRSKKTYLYASYNRVVNPSQDIYLGRETRATTSLPNYFFNLGINFTIETTAGSYSKPIEKMDAVFRRKNIAGFFGGIGPSAAFPTASSSYIKEKYPFLDNLSMASVFPDIALGYHFSKQDFIIATSFRPIQQNRTSFGFEQEVRRISWGLEGYKFLGDYHGFSPFLGAGINQEWLSLTEKDRGTTITDLKTSTFTPSIVFGWDIRPSFRADFWLLRTNLRYSPFLNIEEDSKKISLQHLEFNFIQFVFYPQRFAYYKRLLKRKS